MAVPADGTAWIKLLPAGSFTCRDGRGPFHAGDSAELQSILSQTQTLLSTTEMMVDYDHQSIFGAVEGVGGTAKAAGWIKAFEIREDGIYGHVHWTEAAMSTSTMLLALGRCEGRMDNSSGANGDLINGCHL
ncbi:MAG: phage protease [Roseibium sp.]